MRYRRLEVGIVFLIFVYAAGIDMSRPSARDLHQQLLELDIEREKLGVEMNRWRFEREKRAAEAEDR